MDRATRLPTLIPRGTARWKKLYRLHGSVERENSRLKHEWALLLLRVRRLERVQLHADLTILSRLARQEKWASWAGSPRSSGRSSPLPPG